MFRFHFDTRKRKHIRPRRIILPHALGYRPLEYGGDTEDEFAGDFWRGLSDRKYRLPDIRTRHVRNERCPKAGKDVRLKRRQKSGLVSRILSCG